MIAEDILLSFLSKDVTYPTYPLFWKHTPQTVGTRGSVFTKAISEWQLKPQAVGVSTKPTMGSLSMHIRIMVFLCSFWHKYGVKKVRNPQTLF